MMTRFELDPNALIFFAKNQRGRIEPWGQDSLRVQATVLPSIRHDWPGALLPTEPVQPTISINGDQAFIENGKIRAEVSLAIERTEPSPEERVRFIHTETGEELLGEQRLHFIMPGARYFRSVGGDLFHLEAMFKAYPGERIYGLGQHQHGLLDQKEAVIELLQRNTEVCIPFLLSNRNYGFFMEQPGYRACRAREQCHPVGSGSNPQLDYWITAGDQPAEILKKYTTATGHPPPFPEWTSGFWQCKLRYRTQEELLSVAREHKRRGFPLSVIVADFFHTTLMADWQFDQEHWPDPAAMVQELDEMGVKVMVSIWPTVNARSESYNDIVERGWLVQNARGVTAHTSFVDTRPDGPISIHFYDATNSEVRRYVWEKVCRGYYQHGIRVWWLDADEPELYPMDPDNLRYHLGDGQAVTNIYPLMHAQGFFEGMQAKGEQEIISLSRSAWAGCQR